MQFREHTTGDARRGAVGDVTGCSLSALFMLLMVSIAQAGTAEDCADLDPTRSLAGCSMIIELGPTPQVDTVMAYSNRGRAYMVTGEFEKALADFDEAIRLQPQFAAAYSHRGNVHFTRGRNDLALQDYAKAIELDPSNSGYYYNRGNLYLRLRQIDLGINDLTIAIKLSSNYAGAYANRGIGYALKGDKENAILDFKKALEINPKHEPARRNLEAFGIEANPPSQ